MWGGSFFGLFGGVTGFWVVRDGNGLCMPVYEYVDTRSGERVVLVKAVAERDCVPGHLKRVLSAGVGFVGLARQPEQRDDVFKGLKKCEEQYGTSALVREFGPGWSANRIKKVWEDRSYDVD